MTAITGACPVISAIFHADGTLDIDGFRAVAAMLVASGAASTMVFGVATENAKLTDDERDAMLTALVEVRGSAPMAIVATVADHSTELAVRRLQRWQDMGADVINILPSRFLDPPKDQASAHLSALLRVSELPVILQYLPQAGASLPLDDLVDLHIDHPRLVQIKVEEIPAAPAVRLVGERSGGRLTALVGWGGLEWLEAAAAGAVGVQPGCSLTEIYVHAQEHLDRGDRLAFEAVFEPLRAPLQTWLRHVEVLIAIEKHLLMRRGLIAADRCRHPSATLKSGDYAAAEQALAYLRQVREGTGKTGAP
jgi:4-hydroxy-tetrahydrodipicolinate synthase